MYNILDIFQYVTQNSTCTRQNTLYFIIFELIPMYTLVSDVYECLKETLIRQLSSKPGKLSWKTIELPISRLWVRVLLWTRIFYFVLVFCTPGRSAGLIQMKSSMTSIRGYRCIEKMVIWKKMAALQVPSTHRQLFKLVRTGLKISYMSWVQGKQTKVEWSCRKRSSLSQWRFGFDSWSWVASSEKCENSSLNYAPLPVKHDRYRKYSPQRGMACW